MEGYELPRNRKCRCDSDRCHHYLRSLSVRLGDRQWKRQPSRELFVVRICGTLHLPNIHRLPSSRERRNTSALSSTRFPTASPNIHGFLFHTGIHPECITLGRTLRLYLYLGSLPDDYALHNNISGLPYIRLLCSNSDHSRYQGIGSSRSISGA